jgi:hypothetical protein
MPIYAARISWTIGYADMPRVVRDPCLYRSTPEWGNIYPGPEAFVPQPGYRCDTNYTIDRSMKRCICMTHPVLVG